MSDRIGGRSGGVPDTVHRPTGDLAQPAVSPGPKEAAAKEPLADKDAFERPQASPPSQTPVPTPTQLQARLQNLTNRPQAPKLQFSNADMAYLAQTFAALVQQNPGASKLKRARLFTKAIIKRGRKSQMFPGATEAEMEQMCDAIADALDGSPVFGQLVDDVTEGTGKLNG